MNACSARCAWCGRCEDGIRESPPMDVFPMCDACGGSILFGARTLAGVGIACSDQCLNRLCLQHEAALMKRGA